MPADGYLIDTDVFIDHLRGHARIVIPAAPRRISVITRAELLAGRRTDPVRIERLLATFDESPVDRSVAEEAGRLRRETGIPLADAIIAATALLTGSVLLTRNRTHFERVPNIRVAEPARG